VTGPDAGLKFHETARHFDLCGPLPEPGITVLEASAGTGKTFTVAALVARLIAEGVASLDEILVVTFTRMATGQLRDRVRARLVSAEVGLRRMLEVGEVPPRDDALLALLAQAPSDGRAGPEGHQDALGAAHVLVQARRERLAGALANFDSATITTTHGFCHMVLAALGAWGEVAPGASLLEDPRDLVEEVVDDLVARHALTAGPLPFRRGQALGMATDAVCNPGTPLEPPAVKSDTTPGGLRRRLAEGARAEVGRRLLDANLLTYDDLLVRLAKALADPARGPTACSRLRERYRVVLVDEFQDTDLVQWEVVSRAFAPRRPGRDGPAPLPASVDAPASVGPADDGVRLVLIGDPKQAVYGFRGGDVYAYLEAARAAGPGHRFTLDENWRSDGALLASFGALLAPLHLGHPEIVYRQASAAGPNLGTGLSGAPVGAPLRARVFDRSDQRLLHTRSGLVQKDSALTWVACDLALDVVALLASGAQLEPRSPGEPGLPGGDVRRPVEPHDIGVLVRTNRQATIVQGELRAAGVPVVVAGAESVLSTSAARDWLRLLEALEQPASRSSAVAAALTDFVGMPAEHLVSADERSWEDLYAHLHEWAALARRDGVAVLFGQLSVSQGLPARLLAEIDGERRLTDLRHIAELLHAEAVRSQLGLAALRAWLARRIDEASPDGAEAEERSRRLDTGSPAVQILTVHRAKGLEFPIVYCPYLWDAARWDHFGGPVIFHDPSDNDRRKLDVGGEKGDPVYEGHFALSQAERRGEDLRHLYVALSRAKHQVVLWWVPAQNCQHSALGRVLLSKHANGDVDPSGKAREPRDAEVLAALQRVAERAPGLVSVEHASERKGHRWPPVTSREADRAVAMEGGTESDAGPGGGPKGEATAALPAGTLAKASFGRDLDASWRRYSYTGLTAAAYGHDGPRDVGLGTSDLVTTEPEDPGTTDEPQGLAAGTAPGHEERQRARGVPQAAGPNDEQLLRSTPSPWAALPASAGVGTFVHRVLERADFAAANPVFELHRAVEAEASLYPGEPGDLGILTSGLAAAISVPLGPLVEGSSLRDAVRADRLDELRFELPLAGGDQPIGDVLVADLARVFAEHVPARSPLAAYAAALSAPELAADLRGYLTGSLDLVMRRRARDGYSRYFVVDYKTNWLAAPGEALSAWHYRPSALEAEMCRAHYPLQALFYLVALHRYLRWRVPGYEPASQLGGALYLFLRGMIPGAPVFEGGQPCGVFSWCPPASLVAEVSDLLAGRPGRARVAAPAGEPAP
jgi:exodeoxyribonuclease V beta subunit